MTNENVHSHSRGYVIRVCIFIFRSSSGDTATYISNGEWDLVGVPAVRHNILYSCCENPYPDVTFWIVIRRKPLYYVFNLVIPCIVLTVINLLVFYLPPESGEKVSLGVTMLLALTVFLLIVADAIPPQSNSIPLIGRLYSIITLLIQCIHLSYLS